MKAIGVKAFGRPDALERLDQPLPEPGADEVQVELVYAGINFIDVYMRNGTYAKSHTYKTPLPMVLGMEGAGHVKTVGKNVTHVAVGDRVAYCLARGSYAECANVPGTKVVPVPDDVPFDIATTLQLQGTTAHYLSHSAYALKPGDTCLIHAGAGGVGQLLVQLAKRQGATVITTVGSEEKAEIARERGADHTVLYKVEAFRGRVHDITNGEGVHVVYDSVGQQTIADSIACLRKRGTCVNFGASSGVVKSVAPLDLAEAGSVFFTRPHLADYLQTHAEIRTRTDDLFAAYTSGALAVTIDEVFALDDAIAAHEKIEAGLTKGKLLLKI